MSLQALHVLVPPAWLAATLLHFHHYGVEATPREVRLRKAVTGLALGLHVTLFTASWMALGHAPLQDAWSTLSCIVLALAVLHFATTRFIDNAGTGAIVMTLVTVTQLAASAFGNHHPQVHDRPGTFFLFHVMTSVTATAAVLLSGINGGLYLLVYNRMRSGRFDTIVKGLPSLDTLAKLTRRAALAGFLLLTVGVNFGIGWAHYAGVKGFEYSDPFVVFVLAVWVHFGVVAFSKRIPGLSARRASLAAAAGLTVFVSIYLLTLIPEVTFHWSPR